MREIRITCDGCGRPKPELLPKGSADYDARCDEYFSWSTVDVNDGARAQEIGKYEQRDVCPDRMCLCKVLRALADLVLTWKTPVRA